MVENEVIEISSDSEDEDRRRVLSVIDDEGTISMLMKSIKQGKAAQRDNKRLLFERRSKNEEIAELQRLLAEKDRLLKKGDQQTITKLKCPICVGDLSLPYVFYPCGHSFCRSCIEGMFRPFLKAHKDTLLSSGNQTLTNLPLARPEYACGVCKSSVRHPPVVNHALLSVLDVKGTMESAVSPSSQPNKALPCDWVEFFPATKDKPEGQ